MWDEKKFIETCDKNVELISKAYKKGKGPLKLNSYLHFEHWHDKWWNDFNHYVYQTKHENKIVMGQQRLNIGFIKFRLKHIHEESPNIPIVQAFSKHLFSKVFKSHHIAGWISEEVCDLGTDWHEDYTQEIPTYLICLNLIGDTHWQFDGYPDIDLSSGEILCQNGSCAHTVEPKGKRITLAGYSKIDDIII